MTYVARGLPVNLAEGHSSDSDVHRALFHPCHPQVSLSTLPHGGPLQPADASLGACCHLCTVLQPPEIYIYIYIYIYIHIQWGKKVFSQPPIVQVLPHKKMREACNFHNFHHFIKSRKSHCRIFYEFICKWWWKISIWSPTNKHTWSAQTWVKYGGYSEKREVYPAQ